MNTIRDTNRLLARTVNAALNLGGDRDQGWCIDLTDEELDRIKQAGFSAIRVGMQWTAHCEAQVPYTIDPAAFEKADRVLAGALARGLAVVLCNFRDPELMANPAAYRERYLSITRQVSAHYHDAPGTLLIELLAEPSEKLDAVWNDYLAAGLAVLREQDRERAVIVGPASYNAIRKLPDLKLPAGDRNLIVTVHHYWPIRFTMQGEAWFQLPWLMTLFLGNPKTWPGTEWRGTPQEQGVLRNMLDQAARWATANDRPMFVGEFGSSSTAPMESRVRWARFIRRLCDERGFPWGVWSYGPSFALYDAEHGRWHEDLLAALMEPEGKMAEHQTRTPSATTKESTRPA